MVTRFALELPNSPTPCRIEVQQTELGTRKRTLVFSNGTRFSSLLKADLRRLYDAYGPNPTQATLPGILEFFSKIKGR